MYLGKDSLIKEIKKYLDKLGIEKLDRLINLGENELLNLIRNYDTDIWKNDLYEKSTLHIYSKFKDYIQEENFYDNTFESMLLFRGRSNTLKLNWRRRFESGETKCEICNSGEEETLEHFLVKCGGLDDVRGKYGVRDRKVEELLMFSDALEVGLAKRFIGDLWRTRKLRIG